MTMRGREVRAGERVCELERDLQRAKVRAFSKFTVNVEKTVSSEYELPAERVHDFKVQYTFFSGFLAKFRK